MIEKLIGPETTAQHDGGAPPTPADEPERMVSRGCDAIGGDPALGGAALVAAMQASPARKMDLIAEGVRSPTRDIEL